MFLKYVITSGAKFKWVTVVKKNNKNFELVNFTCNETLAFLT